MPTYLYECPIHGEFEREHPITEELEYCPICEEKDELEKGERRTFQKVKKLIYGGTGFILNGSGWGREGYSK